MKYFTRSWHLKVNKDLVLDVIKNNKDNFFCPFSVSESYLNIYKNRECSVQFLNLQECDYARQPNKAGKTYIKYLMSVEKKLNNIKQYNFLKNNFDKFSVETNEENFIKRSKDTSMEKLLAHLNFEWAFDASIRPAGDICRARIVKLPAKGTMPYHRDETSSKNIRVICPIITHPDIENGFRQNKNEEIHHLPATGHYYTFDDHRIEHAVFNKSNIDRYALVFTVINVDNLKEWDRKYKKNKMFWKAWSNGM